MRLKFTKSEAEYTDLSSSPAEHRCGICTYIRGHGVHTCAIVQGEVKDLGGCKKFDLDVIANANSKISIADYPPK